MRTEYLPLALQNFSGYIAADELYDGPFCILSIVDNRTFTRLMYEVLEHAPTKKDISAFFQEFKTTLDLRGLALRGITTDGSALYPEPIATVFGAVPHQICEFHIIKDVTHAILRALAKVRKELASRLPHLPKGRPTKATQKVARRKARQEQKIRALFEGRFLLVQHELSAAERKKLQTLTRGLPHLRRLREIMDQVYGLFDRRCSSATALAKLAKLRRRVRRFDWIGKVLAPLFSPNLEKALTFLDDSLLPSTSNAVERGNRRLRKMQKSVYRVRGLQHIRQRLALDLWREAWCNGRRQTLVSLHHARAG